MRNTVQHTFAAGLTSIALLFAGVPPAHAQAKRAVTVAADLLNEPGGVQLLHILRGTTLAVGPEQRDGFQATISGWIPEALLRDDKRDGFDLSVAPAAGTTLRNQPGGWALASARLGALFDRIEVVNHWVHVKRTGWIVKTAFVPVAPAPGAAAPATVTPAAPLTGTTTTVSAGASLASQAGGTPVATLESPLPADVVEHRNGWAHVRVDAWVRDGALGNAPAPAGITAAEIRAAPEKYVGQTVEWTVQLLGIQKADELRPEMPAGQPFLLVRGPLPETGFVYVMVTEADADRFRTLDPLSKIRIRATIRAGKSRFLPTPVLTLVRRLD